MMLYLPSPSAIFFHISKGKPCQSASLACLDKARNTIFAGTSPWCTAWKGAQRSWCFEQVMQMPPKPVSWAHMVPPRHLNIPTASQHRSHPQSTCRTQCGKEIWFFQEELILAIWKPLWQMIMSAGMCLICVRRTNWKCLWFWYPVRTTALHTHQTSLVYKQSKYSWYSLAEMDFAEVPWGQEAPWLWVLLKHLQSHQRAHSPVKHFTNIHQTT